MQFLVTSAYCYSPHVRILKQLYHRDPGLHDLPFGERPFFFFLALLRQLTNFNNWQHHALTDFYMLREPHENTILYGYGMAGMLAVGLNSAGFRMHKCSQVCSTLFRPRNTSRLYARR